MRPYLCALVLLSAATGCVTVSKQQYANMSAGVIGCPVEELTISGEKNSYSVGEQALPWTAECRGHRFICSAAGQTVSCKEELKTVEAPAAAPAAAQAAEGPQ